MIEVLKSDLKLSKKLSEVRDIFTTMIFPSSIGNNQFQYVVEECSIPKQNSGKRKQKYQQKLKILNYYMVHYFQITPDKIYTFYMSYTV